MKGILFLCLFISFSVCAQQRKALVGGTLIDGFGGEPIKNSVILIEGGKIIKVGQVGTVAIPSKSEPSPT